MRSTKLDEETFVRWQAKATVRIPQVARVARQLYKQRIVEALLGTERHELQVALDHAKAGEGRAEFDALANAVRRRLWPLQQSETLPRRV